MPGRALTLGVVLAAMLAAIAIRPAGAGSLLELNFYLPGPGYTGGPMPNCDYPDALENIRMRFAKKEGTFWMSPLGIVGFEKVRETAYRPWAPNSVPRRFCSAVAQVSDGSRRPVHYSIGETTGFLGAGWGVEWCVTGLDRNWAYNPACKMARP